MRKKKIKKYKITDQEFIDVLNKVTQKLIYKFKFGYHEIEDMRQQAAIFALQAMEKYDNKRPLENFLWTHIRNRLFNFKRDNYQRPDKPNIKSQEEESINLFNSWESRNERKKNLSKTNVIPEGYDASTSSNFVTNISNQELLDLIESQLSYQYREIFIRVKYGDKVKATELKKLQNQVQKILNKYSNE